MRKTPIVYLLVTAGAAGAAPATEWRLAAGPERVHVLELYTSEGCSSCPPADRYLRSLRSRADLWKGFVPLAYHVDYWNYLGWNDRFSSEAHADRQRALAALWKKGGVYTPDFVLDGGDVGPSGAAGEKDLSRRERVGTLEVAVASGAFRVRFAPSFPGTGFVARGAVLGNGLSTAVASGENARALLPHDFVVLSTVAVSTVADGTARVATLPVPDAKASIPGTRSLVFWIERENDPRPVQAAGADVSMEFLQSLSKKEIR